MFLPQFSKTHKSIKANLQDNSCFLLCTTVAQTQKVLITGQVPVNFSCRVSLSHTHNSVKQGLSSVFYFVHVLLDRGRASRSFFMGTTLMESSACLRKDLTISFFFNLANKDKIHVFKWLDQISRLIYGLCSTGEILVYQFFLGSCRHFTFIYFCWVLFCFIQDLTVCSQLTSYNSLSTLGWPKLS